MEALLALLESSGLPVAYLKWDDPPEPPYLVYLFVEDNDLVADDSNYASIGSWQVELYGIRKDPAAEAAVESALRSAGLVWQKREAYVEAEDMHQVLYLFDMI